MFQLLIHKVDSQTYVSKFLIILRIVHLHNSFASRVVGDLVVQHALFYLFIYLFIII